MEMLKCPECGVPILTLRVQSGGPTTWTCACGVQVSVPHRPVPLIRGPDMIRVGDRWEYVVDEAGNPCSLEGTVGELIYLVPSQPRGTWWQRIARWWRWHWRLRVRWESEEG